MAASAHLSSHDNAVRQRRQTGAAIGAAIAAGFVLMFAAAGMVASVVGFEVAPGLWAVAGACAIAIPVAALLGWTYAISALSRWRTLAGMALLAVIGTDALISLGFAVLGMVLELPNRSFLDALGMMVIVGIIGFGAGLVIYGLPGLVIAGISAYIWQRAMYRRFPTG